MANRRDAESSFLSATAQVSEWRQKFMQTWLEPDTEMALLLLWYRQPPEVHQQLAMMRPEEHAQLEKKVREIEEKYNGLLPIRR